MVHFLTFGDIVGIFLLLKTDQCEPYRGVVRAGSDGVSGRVEAHTVDVGFVAFENLSTLS